jgi:hypothetical protein
MIKKKVGRARLASSFTQDNPVNPVRSLSVLLLIPNYFPIADSIAGHMVSAQY